MLRLDKNQLPEFPHIICELSNLTILNVHENQSFDLHYNIKHLKNLQEPYLSDNQ